MKSVPRLTSKAQPLPRRHLRIMISALDLPVKSKEVVARMERRTIDSNAARGNKRSRRVGKRLVTVSADIAAMAVTLAATPATHGQAA